MARDTKYDVLKHDPKTCFICLGLKWDPLTNEWVPDERRAA